MKLNPITHLDNIQNDIERAGLRGLLDWTARVYYMKLATVEGMNVFDTDWDVLIILDACRADLFDAVAPAFEYLDQDDITHSTSVGSRTDLWMERTFTVEYENEMSDTTYISGNPHTRSHSEPPKFASIDEVWRYAWDTDIGTVPPRSITDRAITTWRSKASGRLLLHYMQPHIPFIPADQRSELTIDEFGENRFDDTWIRLQKGDFTKEDVWDQYKANLEYVLEDIKLLLKSIDADSVVITSDHGNAFGEYGLFGHYRDASIPALRTVPWAETTAKRTNDYEPPDYNTNRSGDNVSDQLSALGYKQD